MQLPSRVPREPTRADRASRRHALPTDRSDSEIFVATVHAADGILLATAAESRAGLVHRLAGYVRRRAVHVLRADHARHVRGLLARGELEAAVEVYFGLVGERWDEEWLVTASVTRDGWLDVSAALDAVAQATGDVSRAREA